MKWNLVLLIAVLVSAPANLSAQRGGAVGGGRGISRAGSTAWPTRRGLSYSAGNRRGRVYDHTRYSAFWADPFQPYYGDYWDFPNVADDGDAVQPGPIVLIPVPQAPAPVPPPPPPPTPTVHEYSWPDSNEGAGTAFFIILKNGTVQRAIAVWVQEDRLCFITPEGESRQVLLNDVDRQNTTRINGEQKLKLPWITE